METMPIIVVKETAYHISATSKVLVYLRKGLKITVVKLEVRLDYSHFVRE